MAPKKSPSGGLAIIGFLVLAIAIKFWQFFIIIGIFALAIWIIIKITGSRSKADSSQIGLSHYHSQTVTKQDSNGVSIIGASARESHSVDPDSVWVPQGTTIQHAGYSIPGGLLYFGQGLKSVRNWSEEPALIAPNLPIDKSNPDWEGKHMSYWPSYSQIHPASRAALLDWLSKGKKDPQINIGYVFLYFYGLERRALSDASKSATAQKEIPVIIAEVTRLLSIYAENSSFRQYASNFLDTLQVSQAQSPLYHSRPQITSASWEIPLKLKVALGQMATDSVPVSAEWALVWAENDPSMPRRTPSQRCREEFRELFKLRYIEKFGEGLRLKSNKSFIRASYHPASSSFGGYVDIALPNLPDLTKISGPSSKICGIVNACTDELEGYSRYLGRNPGEKNSIEALSYLPQPLLKIYDGKEIQNLTNWLNNEASSDIPVTVPFSSILEQIPLHQGAFGKKEATALSSLLCKMSFGIEPDPRFGNFIPRPERDVVIFKIGSQAPNSPTAEYSAATTVLHLASAVACADGSVDASEEYLLEKHIETWFHLSPDEQTRLRAHTKWLLTFFPGMNGVKKRIELLKQDQRDSLGRFLIAIAQADGHMEPAEMKVLTNIYNILGLDVQNLFSQVHAAATEPVTVQPPNILKPSRYAIPSAPPKPVGGVSLDMDTVNAKIAETVAVSAMLNNIFIEDEPKPPIVSIEPSIPGASLTGLDSDSFAFMQILTSKPAWNREELERLAADRCLMLDGTLDCINDAAFDHFGGPFFEGDDPIEINLEYAKEIAA